MNQTWIFLLMFLFSQSIFGNISDDLKKCEQMIKNRKTTEGLEILNKITLDPKDKENEAKKLYLYSWAYWMNQNYPQAIYYSKKVTKDFQKTKYYYPTLILAAEISYDSGDINTATKIVDFIIANPSSIPDEFLFSAYFMKLLWFKQEANFTLEKLSLGTFRILYLNLTKNPIKELFKQSNVQENQSGKGLKAIQLKKIKDAIINPKVGNLLGKNKDQEQLDTPKDIEELRKELLTRKKELEIQELLLEEKRRLLYLKEEYLKKKEEIEKPKGEAQ